MALFGRKKEVVPVELEPFYEQEPLWRIWLRRILAAVVLIALVAAIIWAAVTVYRQVTNKDISVQQEGEIVLQTGSDDVATTSDASSDDQTTTSGAEQGTTSGVVSDESASTTQDSTSNVATLPGSEDTESTAGAQAADLPKTGATETVLLLAGIIAVAAAGAHYAYQYRRL